MQEPQHVLGELNGSWGMHGPARSYLGGGRIDQSPGENKKKRGRDIDSGSKVGIQCDRSLRIGWRTPLMYTNCIEKLGI